MYKRYLLSALTALAACAQPETERDQASRIESESQAAQADIGRIIADYERWLAAGQTDSIATMVTDDHASMPPNLPPTSGKGDWLARFSPMFAQGQWTLRHVTESVVANGPIAVHRGRFTMSFAPATGAPAGAVALADTGKFMWQWRRVEGRWMLAAAIWNSNMAPNP